ncbi:hypothetical protein GF342_02650 [Candidatus Woesearchaeota archaeon]|nr:hypothetical protein [Candidatus Woesearchaeota archaeon]
MEVQVKEEKKGHLHVDIVDSPIIAMNMLKQELWQNNHVKATGTNIDHPLLNKQTFVLDTDGAEPRKVIASAVKKLHKELDKAAESLKSVR